MRRYTVEVDGKRYEVEVEEGEEGRYEVRVGGRRYAVRWRGEAEPAPSIEPLPEPPVGPAPLRLPRDAAASAPRVELRAPMPGTLLSVSVAVGDPVERGQELMVLEAMKMRNPIRSPRAGVVAEVPVQAGQSVAAGALLLRYEVEG